MTVERSEDQAGPATLTIYLSNKSIYDANTSTDGERTDVIDMKHKHSMEILKEFMHAAQGEEVKATSQEQEQRDELEQQQRRAEADRERMRKYLAAQRREAEILKQARKSVAAQAG